MYYDAVIFKTEEEVRNFMTSSEFDYRKTLVIESVENEKLPKSPPGDSLSKNSVKIAEYSLNTIKIDVETEADGLLYLSEVYYPAWNAYVDGNRVKILKTDFCMRSVPVSKGIHKVELRYESDVFATGKKISLLTLMLFVISVPLSVYFNRKQKNHKGDENTG
jgi:hypothetical protein